MQDGILSSVLRMAGAVSSFDDLQPVYLTACREVRALLGGQQSGYFELDPDCTGSRLLERDPPDSSEVHLELTALLDAAAKDYAEKNTGWPKRTETCDKAS